MTNRPDEERRTPVTVSRPDGRQTPDASDDALPDALPTAPEETQELIESLEAESPTRKLIGISAVIVTIIAVGLSVYALYAT
ncbi:MAG: hypothetical protein M3440_08820, partial [Chloroflexota bacterium]|nr:hypothetical protein [Chloroflexota bacterium]